MFKALGKLAPFVGMLQTIMKGTRKGEAIVNRTVEQAYQVRSKEDFFPALQSLFKDFFPNGIAGVDMNEVFNHEIVQKFHSMTPEQAQSDGISMIFNLLSDHGDDLKKFTKENL